ncbi:hypothetical protein [Paenibacillus flagellatus]|uniref:Uncharacterized protein n=1 Tax=Paenibacillus flagellatus TaxID=2211139 RepID=A0A2V5K2M1_9BACL|nr:hypothetical protein [Paenibacillus flagellatus]PYI51803.1 hypothetical protein DLM86_23060 [Paenibacillus flagellatus]
MPDRDPSDPNVPNRPNDPNHSSEPKESAPPPETEIVDTSAPPPDDKGRKPWKGGKVWAGIGLVALLHLLLLAVPVAFFFIGVAQVVYVVPALLWFRKDPAMMQGILIGAGITFLLNAACFGIVLFNFS